MPTLKLKLKLKSSRMSTRTNRTPETIQRNKKGDASASSFLCFCQPNGIMACGPSNAEYDSKHVRFDFQLNRKASENIRLDPLRQRQQLLPGGLTIIDQHQRLQPMHPGIALAKAFPTGALDQPASGQLDPTIGLRIGHQIGMFGIHALRQLNRNHTVL